MTYAGCKCRCIKITEYKAATFGTEEIVGCLKCNQEVLLKRTKHTLKLLRRKCNGAAATAFGAGVASAAAIVATGGASEVLTGGFGVGTASYAICRTGHAMAIKTRLKKFKNNVLEAGTPVRECLCCSDEERSSVSGFCSLSLRKAADRGDDEEADGEPFGQIEFPLDMDGNVFDCDDNCDIVDPCGCT